MDWPSREKTVHFSRLSNDLVIRPVPGRITHPWKVEWPMPRLARMGQFVLHFTKSMTCQHAKHEPLRKLPKS